MLLLLSLPVATLCQKSRFQFQEQKMGSPFGIIMYAEDSATAADIAQRAFLLVDSLNMIFSDYEKNSEINKLSSCAGRDSFISVSPLLFDVLRRSKEAWRISDGRFDITIGTLSHLWRGARKANRFPQDSLIKEALLKTGMRYLILDEQTKSVKLQKPGMALDLGGIAKGFIAQYILNFLKHNGYASALVDAGGDIACGDAPPEKEGWSIAVSLPIQNRVMSRNIVLKNQGVATSGNLYQYIEHNGKKFSHEIDPKTGYGTLNRKTVTIVSSDATLSDWLATACRLSSVRKSKRMAKRMNARMLILEIKKSKVSTHSTGGFRALWR